MNIRKRTYSHFINLSFSYNYALFLYYFHNFLMPLFRHPHQARIASLLPSRRAVAKSTLGKGKQGKWIYLSPGISFLFVILKFVLFQRVPDECPKLDTETNYGLAKTDTFVYPSPSEVHVIRFKNFRR